LPLPSYCSQLSNHVASKFNTGFFPEWTVSMMHATRAGCKGLGAGRQMQGSAVLAKDRAAAYSRRGGRRCTREGQGSGGAEDGVRDGPACDGRRLPGTRHWECRRRRPGTRRWEGRRRSPCSRRRGGSTAASVFRGCEGSAAAALFHMLWRFDRVLAWRRRRTRLGVRSLISESGVLISGVVRLSLF
jgi:hypothetical protein